MTHSLLFDETLELIDPDGVFAENGFWFETLSGTSWGEAQPVEVAINSLLRDGALTQTERDENREVNVLVLVKATDGMGVTEGTKALNRATRKRTTLVWTPPDGYAEPRVFEVETSSLHSPDDFDDLAWVRNEQVFRLRLVCLPYWRSATLTTETAEGVPSVGEVVNAGTSLTNWSVPTATVPGPTFGSQVPADPQPVGMLAVDESAAAAKAYAVGGSRYVSALGGSDARRVDNRVTLTQAIGIDSGAYLSFEVKFDVPVGRTLTSYYGETYQETGVLDTLMINAGSASRVYKKYKQYSSDRYLLGRQIIEALDDGWLRYTLRLDEAMSVSSLVWEGQQLVPYLDDAEDSDRPRIKIRNVAVAETATLGKQILKTIDVGGSARTTGALHVAAPSDSVALGQVLAFTVPQSKVAAGWMPDLAQWVLPGAGTETVGGRAGVFDEIGGSYGTSGSPVFTVPASMFRGGAYTLAASIYRGSTTLAFTVEASLMLGSTVISTQELSVQMTVAASTWELVVLGTMYLPPTMMQSPSTDATVRFRFKGASAPVLEELYTFPVEGDLSIIECGSGTVGPGASSHLWIDSPSAQQPQGGYWRGATPTREDALSAWSTTIVPGTHSFEPGPMLAFVKSGAQGPSVSFDYYERNF